MSLQTTTSQTVGPYLHIGLRWLYTAHIAPDGTTGARVEIGGRVLDGDGRPVDDAVLEIWQANAHGRYAHPEDRQDKPLEPGFHGFGRIATAADGSFVFTTVRPGPVPGPDGRPQAPHLLVSVFARGVLKRLATRLYFPGEAANAADPILALVPAERRATLIARPGSAPGRLDWDVVLHGKGETVFFDL